MKLTALALALTASLASNCGDTDGAGTLATCANGYELTSTTNTCSYCNNEAVCCTHKDRDAPVEPQSSSSVVGLVVTSVAAGSAMLTPSSPPILAAAGGPLRLPTLSAGPAPTLAPFEGLALRCAGRRGPGRPGAGLDLGGPGPPWVGFRSPAWTG